MDYEPPEQEWFPKVGEKVKIACDWTLAMGQIGEVVRIEPTSDQFGEVDGAEIIVRVEDGSEDSYDISDLLDTNPHPCAQCGSLDTEEYQYPEYEQQGKTWVDTEYLCAEHASDYFCIHCGNFWAGVESFDFSPIKGVCENCRVEYEDDDDEYEDDGYYDFYTTYEDIVEGETGGRYIGEGSEASVEEGGEPS
jgi:hypothetical protein